MKFTNLNDKKMEAEIAGLERDVAVLEKVILESKVKLAVIKCKQAKALLAETDGEKSMLKQMEAFRDKASTIKDSEIGNFATVLLTFVSGCAPREIFLGSWKTEVGEIQILEKSSPFEKKARYGYEVDVEVYKTFLYSSTMSLGGEKYLSVEFFSY